MILRKPNNIRNGSEPSEHNPRKIGQQRWPAIVPISLSRPGKQWTPNTKRRNPYTLPIVEDLLQSPQQPTSNISKGHLTGFTDEVLSSLFAVKPELRNRKFELKVNDVRFVSHPTLIPLRTKVQDDTGGLLINVVFALQALASHSVGM